MTAPSLLGWCVYSFKMGDLAHREAIDTYKPPIVRWFLEINRHVNNNDPNTTDWHTANNYADAFARLAAAGTLLIVQLQMSNSPWTASDSGGTLGCSGWKPSFNNSWLASTAAGSPWRVFFDNLRAEINSAGVTAYYGAWNEPDWRQDPLTAPIGENKASPTTPWTENYPLVPRSPFGWSGGTQKLTDMRALYPSLTWTSDGVGTISAGWLSAIGPDTTINVIDVHSYGTTVQYHLDRVAAVVAPFTAAGRTSLPIVLGEYGDDPNGAAVTTDWYQRALAVKQALNAIYPGRFLGIASHTGGTNPPGYPQLYEVLDQVQGEEAMTDFSNTYEDRILNKALRNVDWTPPATVYVALFSAVTDTEVPSGLTELSTGGYTRQSVTFGASSGGTVSNSGAVQFVHNGTGAAWSISHIALVAVSTLNDTTAANFIMVKAFSKSVAAGDTLNFAVGAITATVA